MADEPDVSGEDAGNDGSDDDPGASKRLRELGGYIREQRSRAEYSLRHLARIAGVSNPYLSQIERGLRKPSAEILQAIAKALQISSETLYVKAGILEERTDSPDLEVAIQRDASLNERQRAALIEIYRSFRRENEGPDGPGGAIPETPVADVGVEDTGARSDDQDGSDEEDDDAPVQEE